MEEHQISYEENIFGEVQVREERLVALLTSFKEAMLQMVQVSLSTFVIFPKITISHLTSHDFRMHIVASHFFIVLVIS